MMDKFKEYTMTVVDYTMGSIAVVLFSLYLFGMLVIDMMKVPQ